MKPLQLTTTTLHDDIDKPTYLRLIMTSPRPTTNLCKTLVSAAALDYPTPIIMGLNRSALTDDVKAGLLRPIDINVTLNYLNSVPTANDDDLVLLVDGYNTLFQLRPSVLLQRYYELNRAANKRIRAQLGGRRSDITQRVIFSAQRQCSQGKSNSPACFAVPESHMSPEPTSADGGSLARPRWLSSGFALGPLGDMRALYTRAAEKAGKTTGPTSGQSVFDEIFSEQELARQAPTHPTTTPPRAPAKPTPPNATNHEFGIGLDATSALVHKTAHAARDASFVTLSTINADLPPTSPPRHLPADIALSTPPFSSHAGPAGPHAYPRTLPRNVSWEQVPLLTNTVTGTIPAIINLAPDADDGGGGMNLARQVGWRGTWMAPYARALLERRVVEPVGPVARLPLEMVAGEGEVRSGVAPSFKGGQYVLGTGGGGRVHAWWSVVDRRHGVGLEQGLFVPYGRICGAEMLDGKGGEEGVFADKKGAFVMPEYWVGQ